MLKLFRSTRGTTLTEMMMMLAVLGVLASSSIYALTAMNRRAASTRIMNLAKAAVIGRIQEAGALRYDPPSTIPSALNLGTTTATVNLGNTNSTALNNLPATVTWEVAAHANNLSVPIRRIRCAIQYQYQGRTHSYEMVTYRSPD